MTTIWELDDDEREIEGLDENGRPDPAYAAALGLVRAPFPRRLLAAAVDVVFFLVMQLPLAIFALPLLVMFLQSRITVYGLVNHPRFLLAVIMAGITVLLTLALGIVQLVLHGRKGVTIGKGFCGLRSVNVRTLERPGFWRVVLRQLVIAGAGIVPLVGPLVFFLSPLWDPERRGRGWHDMAAQLWLIDVRKGLQPYDDKRMRIARKTVKVELQPEAKRLPSLATPDGDGGPQAYRPAGRVSAGVLGVARPHRGVDQAPVGLTTPDREPSRDAEQRAEDGRPVLGGYRTPRADAPSASGGGAGVPDIVLGMPTDLTGAPPAASVPVAPAPAASDAALPDVSPSRGEEPAAAPSGPPAVPAPSAAEPAPASELLVPATAPPPPAPAFRLTLDTGGVLALQGAIVLGRDPRPADGVPDAHPVPVPDETRSISKTHVLLRSTARGVEVIDLGSTNGTALVRDGVERDATPGDPVLARPGDAVRFGDRSLTVSDA